MELGVILRNFQESRPTLNYKDAEMALRWTAAGFLEAEKSFRKLRSHADLKILINSLRPADQQLKKTA
jgi:putative transposase